MGILKHLSRGFPVAIAEIIANIASTVAMTVVDAKVEYYITDPDGIKSGCGYFIDHPEDTRKENTFFNIVRRVSIDRGIIKIK